MVTFIDEWRRKFPSCMVVKRLNHIGSGSRVYSVSIGAPYSQTLCVECISTNHSLMETTMADRLILWRFRGSVVGLNFWMSLIEADMMEKTTRQVQ